MNSEKIPRRPANNVTTELVSVNLRIQNVREDIKAIDQRFDKIDAALGKINDALNGPERGLSLQIDRVRQELRDVAERVKAHDKNLNGSDDEKGKGLNVRFDRVEGFVSFNRRMAYAATGAAITAVIGLVVEHLSHH